MILSRWEQLNFSFERTAIPALPGCYVIYLDDELVYVGSTLNLRNRLAAYELYWHCPEDRFSTKWGEYRKVRIKVKIGGKYGEWAMTELRLIRKLKPKFNILCLG
jgi:excinuclease UvrABC nuclease subunit